MVFDIYRRFEIEILREGGRWVVYRTSNETRRADWSLIIPHELREDELAGYLADFFQEHARPGESITCK